MSMSNLATERTARKTVNDALYHLSRTYHQGLPISEIDAILIASGFRKMEDGVYTGHDGHSHEQVGERTWIAFSWHRMGSGRYEINAYVS
jgi:hypothetical protein